MAEAGYPGQTGETPIGIFVPAGTPKEIVESPAPQGGDDRSPCRTSSRSSRPSASSPIGDTPAEFAAFLKAEDEKWGKVIRDAGIKLQ